MCTDIWEGYISAVEEALPNAMIVLDRFHVIRHARDGVDTLRKQELRRLKKELPKDTADGFKHTLWPFGKCSGALDPAEQERLGVCQAKCVGGIPSTFNQKTALKANGKLI